MRLGHYILNDRGEPEPCNDVRRWARFFEDAEARRVALDYVGEGVEVSTVFLALDHNHAGHGPPILWETLVFGGPHDGQIWRYASRADAEAGHARIVAALVSGEDPDA